jgi:hypothetical protein
VSPRTPFANPTDPPLIVHCGYHKVGTVWFSRILEAVGRRYRIKVERGERVLRNRVSAPSEGTGIFIDPHSRVERETLPEFRGSHMVRDPRDMVISGYFYHVWTTEKWAHVPGRMDEKEWCRPEWKGRTYHDILNSLDQEEGLATEIERASSGVFHRMNAWDYEDERFWEMKYRDVIADEDAAFAAMFTHYGFSPGAVERGVAIARRFSFKNVTKRDVGEKSGTKSHLRSGRPGEWQEYFTEEHRRLFESRNPGLLVKLGYESSTDW